ncbi:MAG: carboxylesterase family protein, partial [Candidatus Acidiferrales bacterium]
MARARLHHALIFIFVILFGVAAHAADVVRTTSGVVRGKTSDDGKVRIFEGIPYAAPPVGRLRWRPPQAVHPWKDVRDATKFGARCMQGNIYADMNFRDDGPSEDCLYLNVWTAAKDASANLPVMVWIYG